MAWSKEHKNFNTIERLIKHAYIYNDMKSFHYEQFRNFIEDDVEILKALKMASDRQYLTTKLLIYSIYSNILVFSGVYYDNDFIDDKGNKFTSAKTAEIYPEKDYKFYLEFELDKDYREELDEEKLLLKK